MALETAASVAQLAVTLESCIDAYKFCHRAQRIGADGDFLRTKLQLERIRLEAWAERAGLPSSCNDRLNWQMISHILQQQKGLLTSSEKLKKRYQLNVPEESSQGGGDGEEEEWAQPSPSGVERFLSALRPEVYTPGARAINAANSTLKRLRWAAVGRDKLSRVIDDLSALNDGLEKLLDAADRDWLRSSNGTLLREVLSRTTNPEEVLAVQKLLHPTLSVDQKTIDAAAEFKRIRLIVGTDKREDEIQPTPSKKTATKMPSLKVLKEKKFSSDSLALSERGIHQATYDGSAVLVEWRVIDPDKFDIAKKHIQILALLLGNAGPSFASLQCIGLLEQPKKGRFGLVYEMPGVPSLEKSSTMTHRTLYDLISSQRKVSLEARITVACAMADAVTQLHTSGWLHKNIRSNNVIFVKGSLSGDLEFLNSAPYLVGYDQARPDNVSALTQIPDASLHDDLYRHPSKRGPVTGSYRKVFDLYALACLLTEVALWEPIIDTFSRNDEQDWTSKIKAAEDEKKDIELPSLISIAESAAFTQDVVHAVGSRYLEAIQLCLSSIEDAKDNDETSIGLQRSIGEKLRQCKI